jgi:hypothetical protein
MPYIDKSRRSIIDQKISDIIHNITNGEEINYNKGDLNYIFFTIVVHWLHVNGKNYQNISDAIAALQDCADEVKRRIMTKKEDIAIKTNGDIHVWNNVLIPSSKD